MTPFIPGERCSLRTLTRADVDGPWKDWLNNPEVTRHMLRGVFPNHYEEQVAFYEHVSSGAQTDLVLAIETPDARHVGAIGLHRIDWINRSAEFGILIGEPDVWGTGIGTEATRLICRHGFDRLNLHRIWLGVLASHMSAVRAYEKVGFREEGRLREEACSEGQWIDKVIMGLLIGELVSDA